MNDGSALQFDYEGQRLRFPVAAQEPSQSPSTGRLLRKLQTVFTISPIDAQITKRLLSTSPIADSDGALWTGHLDTESYTNHSAHCLTITWSEAEQLQADVVEFQGLALRPTRYEERANGDGSIAIAFQATLTKEQTDRLRSLVPTERSGPRYWPVVRHGISQEPRSMRLDRVLWQRFDDGTTGHHITLIDEAHGPSGGHSASPAPGGEPMVSNLIRHLSSLLAQYETLLAELESAGALPPEALDRTRASAESLGPDRRHAFFEVFNLPDW